MAEMVCFRRRHQFGGMPDSEAFMEEMMPSPITLTDNYVKIRSIPVGKAVIGDGTEGLQVGPVTISVQSSDSRYEGRLNPNGVVTGLTKLFVEEGITTQSELAFQVTSEGIIELAITRRPPQEQKVSSNEQVQPVSVIDQYVADTMQLKWIHFDAFRPANGKYWIPKTEADVYMVFGLLQELTDYTYCCGASKEALKRIAYPLTDDSEDNPRKPDAILIEKATDRYVIAEFKMNSSKYHTNHQPKDVDVLIVWIDDESDRSLLPSRVVNLYETAQRALRVGLVRENE